VKNSPATASHTKSPAVGRCSTSLLDRSSATHSQRNGTANNSRKNAVALGPTSLRRTSTGANPMHTAPASSAMNAARSIFAVSTSAVIRAAWITRKHPLESRLDALYMSGMRLYFMRHAHAVDGDDDAARPLSPRGREQSEAMAKFLLRAGIQFEAAFASPLVRAHQTAEIVLREMGIAASVKLKIATALENETPESDWNRWTHSLPEHDHVLLVGHAPTLPARVRAIVTISHPATFEMPKGAVACVDTQDRHSGRLKFFVTPRLLGL
jgi:phosphohistidine phosphatase